MHPTTFIQGSPAQGHRQVWYYVDRRIDDLPIIRTWPWNDNPSLLVLYLNLQGSLSHLKQSQKFEEIILSKAISCHTHPWISYSCRIIVHATCCRRSKWPKRYHPMQVFSTLRLFCFMTKGVMTLEQLHIRCEWDKEDTHRSATSSSEVFEKSSQSASFLINAMRLLGFLAPSIALEHVL